MSKKEFINHVIDRQIKFYENMTKRLELVKNNQEKFYNYLENQGYKVDKENLIITKDYPIQQLKKYINNNELDKNKFAFKIASYIINNDCVTVNYKLYDFIINYKSYEELKEVL